MGVLKTLKSLAKFLIKKKKYWLLPLIIIILLLGILIFVFSSSTISPFIYTIF